MAQSSYDPHIGLSLNDQQQNSYGDTNNNGYTVGRDSPSFTHQPQQQQQQQQQQQAMTFPFTPIYSPQLQQVQLQSQPYQYQSQPMPQKSNISNVCADTLEIICRHPCLCCLALLFAPTIIGLIVSIFRV
jgi:hypothetical protein